MAINIDSKIKNTEQVIIGGKTRDIAFNDEFNRKVSDLELTIGKSVKSIKDLDEDVAENMTLDEQKKLIKGKIKEVATAAIKFFDEQFEKGSGQEIYDYYHQSSEALAIVVGQLKDLSDNMLIKHKNITKNKKKKHYTSNN
ncbi:hypothetical protein ACPBEI_07945 [Latilactobacillus sakei]